MATITPLSAPDAYGKCAPRGAALVVPCLWRPGLKSIKVGDSTIKVSVGTLVVETPLICTHVQVEISGVSGIHQVITAGPYQFGLSRKVVGYEAYLE
jgi:hypothetical protein